MGEAVIYSVPTWGEARGSVVEALICTRLRGADDECDLPSRRAAFVDEAQKARSRAQLVRVRSRHLSIFSFFFLFSL